MGFDQMRGILHGGDYNPEQWLERPDILKEDICLMKKAGINSATLGVFSWSVYEPVEGEFHFEWLRQIMDRLYENGIYTILATPSGARPAWLDAAYPEAMRIDCMGQREHHGFRHNHCMSSLIYRTKVSEIDKKLAEQFGNHPGLLLWHISNEFGGECFCPLCTRKFQRYLSEKFQGDIEKLNNAWWTTFWSHRYNSFEQIEPPFANGETTIMGLNLEWKRFTTWNTIDFMKQEIRALHEVVPDAMVTTNFMELYEGLDYHAMAKELDIISWDSYPRFHNDRETFAETMRKTAFHHAVMRSMKPGKPFMLMESAPGLVNWHGVNKLKRPGVHRLSSLQAIACGSDTVQYFQWRKSRGSFEQYHGAVVDHLGTEDTRVFREVEEVGLLLEKLAPVAGSKVRAEAAVLFDWDNRWAIQDMKGLSQQTKNYEETCMQIWEELLKQGIDTDVISSESRFADYKVIIAPMLYLLHPGTAGRLKEFVQKGGALLATYLTGYVDENQLCFLGGFPGDGLSELFGIVSEEIDSLYPTDRNQIRFLERNATFEVQDYAEILRIKDAQVLAVYNGDFYCDMPAITQKICGQGKAYYVAARIEAKGMAFLLKQLLQETDIRTKELPEDVEYHVRSGEHDVYEFYLNLSREEKNMTGIIGENLLNGERLDGRLTLKGWETAVIRRGMNSNEQQITWE